MWCDLLLNIHVHEYAGGWRDQSASLRTCCRRSSQGQTDHLPHRWLQGRWPRLLHLDSLSLVWWQLCVSVCVYLRVSMNNNVRAGVGSCRHVMVVRRTSLDVTVHAASVCVNDILMRTWADLHSAVALRVWQASCLLAAVDPHNVLKMRRIIRHVWLIDWLIDWLILILMVIWRCK